MAEADDWEYHGHPLDFGDRGIILETGSRPPLCEDPNCKFAFAPHFHHTSSRVTILNGPRSTYPSTEA